MSEKLEKFERLAEKRITEVVKKIRLVGNLANKNNYDYTDQHVKQLLDTIDYEIKALKNRFKEENNTDEYIFSFKNMNK
ncbi:hypothetical protein V5E38_14235 [Rossellomorea sp. GAMAL-10_SWC]